MKSRKLLIFSIVLVFFEMATYLSNDLYLPALSHIMEDLAISSAWAQMTLTAWFLGGASLQLITGPLSDHFGRRSTLLWGGVIFIAASLLCAIAHNIAVLLVARYFQGAVVCAIVAAGYASIHELLESEEAIKTLAWMTSVAILAPAFGPLLGGFLLFFYSWRTLFLILVIWGVLILLALKLWASESLPIEKRESLDLKRIFNNYLLLLKNRKFFSYSCQCGFIFSACIMWIVIGPLLVIRTFGLSPSWFGILQAVVFSSFILGTRLIKYLLPRIKSVRLLKTGMNIMLFGAALSTIISLIWPHKLTFFIAAYMVFEFGLGLIFAPLNRLTIESASQPMGMRMAMLAFFQMTGGVIGSILGGIFYNGQIYSLALLILILTIFAFIFNYFNLKKL